MKDLIFVFQRLIYDDFSSVFVHACGSLMFHNINWILFQWLTTSLEWRGIILYLPTLENL